MKMETNRPYGAVDARVPGTAIFAGVTDDTRLSHVPSAKALAFAQGAEEAVG